MYAHSNKQCIELAPKEHCASVTNHINKATEAFIYILLSHIQEYIIH